MTVKLLILGGYGTFGGRLAQLLADEPQLTLIIAGRSQRKAAAFCKSLPASAQLVPAAFDRDADVQAQLAVIAPHIVVDATGPFQEYGNEPYRVVTACIALGLNYLDLADGSGFVKNIMQFDAQAKQRGVYILSGVSSFPVLSAAVLKELCVGMRHIASIKGGIAPSPYAGVGLNVIRAIASYAGKPITLVCDGKVSSGYGLTETMRFTICPPGRLPLHNTRFSLVDVPDLQVIPATMPGLESIWMGAGPVPEILHRMLNGLAWLVRWRIIPSLLPFAKLFHHVINILRWGEHRGGMFIHVTGTDGAGEKVERSWHLLAEGSDGPLIPSMAIEAIIRNVLAGRVPPAGARAALGDVTLADYDALFARRTIYTGFRGMVILPAESPLYRRLLEDVWPRLPEQLRVMHDVRKALTAEGIATVERGKNRAGQLIAKLFGFPDAGTDVPVRVTFHADGGREYWQRNFAGKVFSSVQALGAGRAQGLLLERFGVVTIALAVVLHAEKMQLIVRRWSLFGIPMPLFLAPGGEAFEYVKDGKFHFDVEMRHIAVGRIVRYRGWLEPRPATE